METQWRLSELNEGTNLPQIKRLVTQDNINLYAEASRDFNPIHINEEFAKQTPLGGTVAHGMLILAYVSQVMNAAFGRSWLTGGKLNIRFKAPARPGDTITVQSRISRLEKKEDHTLVHCEVLCQNQNGEAVIVGGTKVKVKL